MAEPLTPEAVLIFAAIKALCVGMKPRARVEYLRDLAAVLDALEAAPVSIREPGVKEARASAAALFRAELPKLLA
jgi:hypothetical protein